MPSPYETRSASVRLAGDQRPRVRVIHPRTTDAQISLRLHGVLLYFKDAESIRRLGASWNSVHAGDLPIHALRGRVPRYAGGALVISLTLTQDAVNSAQLIPRRREREAFMRVQLGALSLDILDLVAHKTFEQCLVELSEAASRTFLEPAPLPSPRTGPLVLDVRGDCGLVRPIGID